MKPKPTNFSRVETTLAIISFYLLLVFPFIYAGNTLTTSKDHFINELYQSSSTKTCSEAKNNTSSLPSPLQIAIILSGSIRIFPEIFERYDEEILKYQLMEWCEHVDLNRERNSNIDFFVSVVYEREEELERFRAMKDEIPHVKYVSIDRSVDEQVKKRFGGRDLCENHPTKQYCNNWLSSLYLMNHANNKRREFVKQHRKNKDYDVIMRLRTDLLFDRFINPRYFYTTNSSNNNSNPYWKGFQIEPRTLYLPFDMHWMGLNDLFAFGDASVMNVYFSQIDHIESIKKERNVEYHPETYLRFLMERENIKYKKLPQVDIKVVRVSSCNK
ncbi:hypothetical protein C9374_012237 [Naegleria lovaniensis]|uniref:Uncharacterized protein n=1 Tax=Naegleria lovaniensis TaxID=51637 RepID=A0AA88KEN0_NAELO|nr:uncharacterized protein C9374_012237 [Naegleria lovaniensis]KAG2373371.1 hypothetical protein C9374_012237 [Naegleria lovaniensis]